MACREVSKWITEKVLVPVEKFFTEAREACEKVKKAIEEQVQKPVENWGSKQERRCRRQSCKWLCACCNKLFCWFITVVVKVVTWAFVTVLKWVPHLVCKVISVVIGVVVELVLKIVARLVTIPTCLYPNPLRALAVLWDLVNDVLDAFEDLLGLVVDLIKDYSDILYELGDFFDGIGRTFHVFGDAVGAIFGTIFGVPKAIADWLGDVFDWVHDMAQAVTDFLLGVLGLDWCRVQKVSGVVVNVPRVIFSVTRSLGWPVVAVMNQIDKHRLEATIDRSLVQVFGKDSERLESAREHIGVEGSLLGVSMVLQPYRMAIHSSKFLRELHNEGILDLYAVAGRFSACQDKWSGDQFQGEVVYTGTQTRVSKSDLDYFIELGPSSVPSFVVHPITRRAFENRLTLIKRKSQRLGVRFTSKEVKEVVVTDTKLIPLSIEGDDASAQRDLLRLAGRNGDAKLDMVPIIAIFGYVITEPGGAANTKLHGLASWFRPDLNHLGPSGVTFRDRFPKTIFENVPPHEIGHYLGLDHEDHTHPGEIMWKEMLGYDWAPMLLNYLLMHGEPIFTSDDAIATWHWITKTQKARNDILP